MNQWSDEKIREALKGAFPADAPPELRRDIWPLMLRRLDSPAWPIHWLDWTVVAVATLLLILVPGAAPILIYFL